MQGKKMGNHQNQFGNKGMVSQNNQGPTSSKMSPALAKAMGGSSGKNIPKKPLGTNSAMSGMGSNYQR